MIDPNQSQTNNESKSDNTIKEVIDPHTELPGASAEEDTFEDDDDDSGGYADEDSHDEYGSSGEKYGWYNGFSDDVIDDAFEGDPEATWNVD